MGDKRTDRRTAYVMAVAVLGVCTGCVVNAPASAPAVSTTAAPAPVVITETPPPVVVTTTAVPPARSVSASGPGVYTFTHDGVTGTIQIPADRLDPRLQKYGDYRRLAKAAAVTYLIAQVDNQSDDSANLYKVVVVTAAGQQIEATSIADYVDRWRNAFADDAAKYNRGIELSNNSHFYLHPGAKGTAILATSQPITSVQRVFVYPTGIYPAVEAHRLK
ncbi:hypothetical protein [Kribbella endophytica]